MYLYTSAPVPSLTRHTQEGSGVVVKTFDSPADFVLICGEPTNEPIVQHGPFVMNTDQVRKTHDLYFYIYILCLDGRLQNESKGDRWF